METFLWVEKYRPKSIDECILPPINQVASIFFNRQVVDKNYGGLAFEEEGRPLQHQRKEGGLPG